MEFKSKFNKGEIVYFIKQVSHSQEQGEFSFQLASVTEITIIYNNNIDIFYKLKELKSSNTYRIHESFLFKNGNELLTLFKNNLRIFLNPDKPMCITEEYDFKKEDTDDLPF